MAHHGVLVMIGGRPNIKVGAKFTILLLRAVRVKWHIKIAKTSEVELVHVYVSRVELASTDFMCSMCKHVIHVTGVLLGGGRFESTRLSRTNEHLVGVRAIAQAVVGNPTNGRSERGEVDVEEGGGFF